jgi:hypothetical protein
MHAAPVASAADIFGSGPVAGGTPGGFGAAPTGHLDHSFATQCGFGMQQGGYEQMQQQGGMYGQQHTMQQQQPQQYAPVQPVMQQQPSPGMMPMGGQMGHPGAHAKPMAGPPAPIMAQQAPGWQPGPAKPLAPMSHMPAGAAQASMSAPVSTPGFVPQAQPMMGMQGHMQPAMPMQQQQQQQAAPQAVHAAPVAAAPAELYTGIETMRGLVPMLQGSVQLNVAEQRQLQEAAQALDTLMVSCSTPIGSCTARIIHALLSPCRTRPMLVRSSLM